MRFFDEDTEEIEVGRILCKGTQFLIAELLGPNYEVTDQVGLFTEDYDNWSLVTSFHNVRLKELMDVVSEAIIVHNAVKNIRKVFDNATTTSEE